MDPTSYIQNPMFFNKIKNNDINVEKIGELSVYDIYPENWVQLINDKMKRDKIKYELKPEAMTDQFKCRKCGSRSTSYYEVQTRSADEPMTQFITCLNCNCRWKQ
jgi:DNA-directed RNA polymerase, subunit M/Transcription elongation factor TFIIS